MHGRPHEIHAMDEKMRKRKMEDMDEPVEWPPPDKTVEKWNYRDLDCAIVKTDMGTWCGYVRVPEGHPDERKDYDEVDVNVHGGCTFRCKAKEGGSWFGFDCAHAGDYVPFMDRDKPEINNKPTRMDGKKMWHAADVREETNSLAEQLDERKNGTDPSRT